MREKQRGMTLFFLIIELFPLVVRFSLLKYLILGKIMQLSAFHHVRLPLYNSLPDLVSCPLPPAKYYL